MDAYGYCYQNPVNIIDPTGIAGIDPGSDNGGGGDDPKKRDNWLSRLKDDNMLKRLREKSTKWVKENIKDPLRKELKPIREGFAMMREINSEIMHEKVGPLYEISSKIGGSTASGIVAGRKIGDVVEKGLELFVSTKKVLGKGYEVKGEVL